MTMLNRRYEIAIFAIFLVFTPVKINGDACGMSTEEELMLKQSKMDLRMNYLERMDNQRNEEETEVHKDIEVLEKEHAELSELVNLLTQVPPGRDFFQAYLSEKCYRSGNSSTYRGKVATTVQGKTCQRWDQQYPHEHEYYDEQKYPENSLSDAENYCRDPSHSSFTWCYTTDPDSRWEACDVTRCLMDFDEDGCYHFGETGQSYKGYISKTVSGRTCQKWSHQYPHEHDYTTGFPDGNIYDASNYCRDPSGWGLPWCYTTDSNTRWEVCDVAKCLDH